MTEHAYGKAERLSIKAFYPLAEAVPHIKGVGFWKVRAQWTGEKRIPLEGEYFLSGAVITAYRALEDMTEPMHIARLVEVREVRALELVRHL